MNIQAFKHSDSDRIVAFGSHVKQVCFELGLGRVYRDLDINIKLINVKLPGEPAPTDDK